MDPVRESEPLVLIEPVMLKVSERYTKLVDAVAAFVVPSESNNLPVLVLFIVLNPVPDDPAVPAVPDDPAEPAVPDVPELPDEPNPSSQEDPSQI
jgi:hypothetical protein